METNYINSSKAYFYDYITLTPKDSFLLQTIDCYEALGWELVKTEHSITGTTLATFKRNRKLAHKEQLRTLQGKLDSLIRTVDTLEAKRTSKAIGIALGLGIIGTLSFGGGLSFGIIDSTTIRIILGIVLGTVGLGICYLGFHFYNVIKTKKSKEIDQEISTKLDQIAAICEEAQKYRG